MAPKVSICIPTYNAEKFLSATIESVLAQTFTDFELVIVDDCSTDATLTIIENYQDSRIRLYKNQTNLGPALTWNRCLEHCKGRYFKLVCHDDVLYPQCVETQVNSMCAHERVVLVASNRDILNSEGKCVMQPANWQNDVKVGVELIRHCIVKGANLIGEPHAVLIDLDIVRQNNLKFGDEFYVIDIDFYAKVLKFGHAVLIRKPLSGFRISHDSASVKLATNQSALLRNFALKLKHSGFYSISNLDFLSFIVCSNIRQFLKLAFYRVVLKKAEHESH